MYYYGNSLLKFRLSKYRYQDNCPPGKIAPRLVLGFVSRSGLVLILGGKQTITPRKIAAQLGLGFGLGLILGLRGNLPQWQLS